MSEPIIYTRNYVDGESGFSMSHGTSFLERIYDRDKNSKYYTSGANDDTTEITIEIEFRVNGVAVERAVDRLILVNHNFEDVDIDYWDGSAWQNWNSDSGITATTSKYSLSSQTIEKFRIKVSATQTADQEKEIAQIYACEELLDIGEDFSDYDILYRVRAQEIQLGDGSLHRSTIKHSQNRTEKYGAYVSFDYLTEATLESLIEIKEDGDAFLWQPESSTRPDEIFYVNWVNPLNYSYNSKVKGAGFRMSMELKEV